MSPCSSTSSRQYSSGRKKVKRDRAACYRENKRLKSELIQRNKVINTLRKRNLRLQKKQFSEHAPPNTKVQKMFKRNKIGDKVIRQLVFNQTVVDSFVNSYHQSKSKKKRKEYFAVILQAKKI